jgi:transcriptional regulator of nitric oxide reductase
VQAHSAVHELQTAVRERPTQLLTQGCASTLARLYELGEIRRLSLKMGQQTQSTCTQHTAQATHP